MYNHEPAGYDCPFCGLTRGRYNDLSSPATLVWRTPAVFAFVSPRMWPTNLGHILVVPNEHHENLYDLPRSLGHAVFDLSQHIARAIRATYPGCTGTSTRQHNEPDGHQDVWHFHQHVFPRYDRDKLYASPPRRGYASIEEQAPYALRLRTYLDESLSDSDGCSAALGAHDAAKIA
ncbi:HIT family protein [Micromonospora orduensis]|uniref:HIT family protein n=1 Tax=Micromonospora orduensis TaxID=1420891 RepID=A0A5C4QTD2_9ACTN|nr:HIT family protein [Micromonospora orduensis]TNH29639.1 HIT family protein [Micromonospora orduensis]